MKIYSIPEPNLKSILSYQNLISHLVKRDFSLKFKRSLLGVLWSLLLPLLQLLILVFVFEIFLVIRVLRKQFIKICIGIFVHKISVIYPGIMTVSVQMRRDIGDAQRIGVVVRSQKTVKRRID